MNLRTRAAAVGVTIILALGTSAVAPAPAQAGSHDASITNVGSISMIVCKSAASPMKCGTSSPRGVLYRGQNSKKKFGWKDTDMLFLRHGECLDGYKGYVGTRWVKVGGSWGSAQSYRIRRC